MSATLAAGERRLEDARSSQTENYGVINIVERNDGTRGVIYKRSIDWKGANLDLNPLLGWNRGWTKGQLRANFPEFAYAAFDHVQPWVFENKKRIDEASQEFDVGPQGQI